MFSYRFQNQLFLCVGSIQFTPACEDPGSPDTMGSPATFSARGPSRWADGAGDPAAENGAAAGDPPGRTSLSDNVVRILSPSDGIHTNRYKIWKYDQEVKARVMHFLKSVKYLPPP